MPCGTRLASADLPCDRVSSDDDPGGLEHEESPLAINEADMTNSTDPSQFGIRYRSADDGAISKWRSANAPMLSNAPTIWMS